MRRREGAAELLDGPLDVQTLRGNLRDLARANRWLSGVELSWHALRNVLLATAPGASLRVLDVGTGAADIPIALARRSREAGRRVEFVATDARAEIVAVAAASAAATGMGDVEVRLADPTLEREPSESFDVVHSSLVLHHHDPDDAEALLREMARIAKSVVIVNDLDRRWLWWAGAWLAAHVFTANRYTRHDAPLSVRRTYRPDELSEVARSAGLREVARRVSRPGYRYALTFVPTAND